MLAGTQVHLTVHVFRETSNSRTIKREKELSNPPAFTIAIITGFTHALRFPNMIGCRFWITYKEFCSFCFFFILLPSISVWRDRIRDVIFVFTRYLGCLPASMQAVFGWAESFIPFAGLGYFLATLLIFCTATWDSKRVLSSPGRVVDFHRYYSNLPRLVTHFCELKYSL